MADYHGISSGRPIPYRCTEHSCDVVMTDSLARPRAGLPDDAGAKSRKNEDRLSKETLDKLRSDVVELQAKCEATALANGRTADQLRASLAKETSRRESLERVLQQKITELQQKTTEAKDATRRWKQTARELNDLRASGQGFYTVTDDYLKELVTRLRFNIQNFAIQYFEGYKPPLVLERTEFFRRYIEPVKNHSECIFSRDRCFSIIQRLLWKVLVEHVFDNFLWAGGAAKPAVQLANLLRPENRLAREGSSQADAQRIFQRWNATTGTLVADAVGFGTDQKIHQDAVMGVKERIHRQICDAIWQLMRGRGDGAREELMSIIDQAVDLDKELSRQLALVVWVFDDGQAGMVFDPKTWKLEKDQSLVIAPAMLKRGKSTGEDYGTETVLLPIEVSVEQR